MPLPKADRLFKGQSAIRVVAQAIAAQGIGERLVAGELIIRWEDAALQLVRREAVLALQRPRMRHELLGCAHFAAALGVGVAEEEVRRKRHGVSQLAAEQRMDRQVERFAHDVEAGDSSAASNCRRLL